MPLLLLEGVGSPEAVLEEAERAEERTADTLGRGGYALAMLPLLDDDEPAVRSLIDDARMARAMEDLASHSATQAEVNWIAARLLTEAEVGKGDRSRIYSRAFDRVVHRHLTELHPAAWGRELAEIREALATSYRGKGARRKDERLPDLSPVEAT